VSLLEDIVLWELLLANCDKKVSRKKKDKGVAMGDNNGCNHQDMHTLCSFDVPSFFAIKYRETPVKHFPTKCANCKVGSQDCLSHVGVEVERA
jgi:hypothetical protein